MGADPDNVYLSSGTDNLALHRTSSAAAGAEAGLHASLDHLGVIVRAADDVDRWAAFLESHGVVNRRRTAYAPRRRAFLLLPRSGR
jgi:hypothetical protein